MQDYEALDRLDRRILHELQLDGKLTNSALAERVSLSESACLRRVRRLEESGMLRGYVAPRRSVEGGLPGQRVRQHHLGKPSSRPTSPLSRPR